MALRIDDEGMHRMIAGERQARKDDLRRSLRHVGIRRHGIADDLVVLFGIERAVVEADARSARGALRDAIAETLDHIGAAVALAVLERDQKAAGRRRVVMIVAAAPGVDIEHAVRRDDHVADMADIVGEDRRAEARGKREAGIVAGTTRRLRALRIRLRRIRLSHCGLPGRQQDDDGKDGHRRKIGNATALLNWNSGAADDGAAGHGAAGHGGSSDFQTDSRNYDKLLFQ